MSNYTTIETEDPEHGDRVGVDDTRVELRWCDECNKYVPACPHDKPVTMEAKTIMAPLVCSCGSKSCGAIKIFGHPDPVYREAIEPLPGQPAKDRRAVELKGEQLRQEADKAARAEGAFKWGGGN